MEAVVLIAWSLVGIAIVWSVASLTGFARFARHEDTLAGEQSPEAPVPERLRLGGPLRADFALNEVDPPAFGVLDLERDAADPLTAE